MKALYITAVLAGVGAGGVAAYLAANRQPDASESTPGSEFISGPQVGAKLPGPFEPLNLNGADAGDECCLFCKYGNNPVAMVFAPKPSDDLRSLVLVIETAATDSKGEVGACVVMTDTTPEAKAQLKKMIDELKLKRTVIGVIAANKIKKYEIHTDAAVTVLLYSNQVVRVNRALKSTELTERVIAEIGQQTADHFAGK